MTNGIHVNALNKTLCNAKLETKNSTNKTFKLQ